MSKFNAYANEPEAIETTRAWLRRESPLVFFYSPSGKGKTTLLGSLFRHPLYHRVLCIDIDQGSSTIAEYTLNNSICERRVFRGTPDKRVGWFNEQIKYARTAACGAIVVEGFTSIHSGMVSANLENVSDPDDAPAAMRAHIGPSNRTGALIESFRGIKQHRLARDAGVPIIVTLNTRYTPVNPGDMKDQRKKVVPDWSPNLTDKAMRASDAFIELDRNAHGVVLHTMQTAENDARKLRACVPFEPKTSLVNAAQLVQQQVNLELPGMFALWAKADSDMQSHIDNLLSVSAQ